MEEVSLMSPYLPLYATHTGTFGINRLVSEPLAAKNVLDVTHRVSIFDIWNSHAIHLLLYTRVQFFLKDTKKVCLFIYIKTPLLFRASLLLF